MKTKTAAQILGALGGSSTSEVKASASKRNGKLGGRPKSKYINVDCDRCGGSGKAKGEGDCYQCRGTGLMEIEKDEK